MAPSASARIAIGSIRMKMNSCPICSSTGHPKISKNKNSSSGKLKKSRRKHPMYKEATPSCQMCLPSPDSMKECTMMFLLRLRNSPVETTGTKNQQPQLHPLMLPTTTGPLVKEAMMTGLKLHKLQSIFAVFLRQYGDLMIWIAANQSNRIIICLVELIN